MNLGQKIKYLRESHKLTQKELSEKINISIVSIRNWESNTKKPSMDAISSLCSVFNISPDFLFDEAYDSEDKMIRDPIEYDLITKFRKLDPHSKSIVSTVCDMELERNYTHMDNTNSEIKVIPCYYSPAAAGYGNPVDGVDYYNISSDKYIIPNSADYAVLIHGNSMYPYIKDGSTVFVSRNSPVKNGDVGIFCVDGLMYCKLMFLDDNHNLSLISANPELSDANIYISSDSNISVRCYGKVILS